MTDRNEPRSSENLIEHRDPAGTHIELTGDLTEVAASLHRRFDPGLGAATVAFQIQLTADRFADARIRVFVPLFVRRFTVEALAPRLAEA